MVNLKVTIGNIKLKNPVMVASGTFGIEYDEIADINSIGALVTKTITLEPKMGNPPPRIFETASGLLNSIGLENKGAEDFVKNKLPVLKKYKTPVIVSIAGQSTQEFVKLAKVLDGKEGIDGLELNLSCPNVKHGNREGLIAQDASAVYETVRAVKKSVPMTVIAKLSPNVTDISAVAHSAQEAGADAVSMVNTFIGMALDAGTMKPYLGNIMGGLSGPAIKPLALAMVCKTYNKINIPIIGIGGIMTADDALEFIICGASAVQIGTANFVKPDTSVDVVRGIEKYLRKHKIKNIRDLKGSLKI